jgi:hypothetical protein
MKGDPDSVVLGSLASKVLRLGEQKLYVTGGIIRIGKEEEGEGGRGRKNRKFNIRNNKKE